MYQLIQSPLSYQQVNVNGVPTLLPVAVTPNTPQIPINPTPTTANIADVGISTEQNSVTVKEEKQDSVNMNCDEEI